MRQKRSQIAIWPAGLLCLGGLVLAASPASTTAALRSPFRDLLRPGQRILVDVQQRVRDWQSAPQFQAEEYAELEQVRQDLASAELRARKLLAENATLQQERDTLQAEMRIPIAKRGSLPLVVPNLLSANVLSKKTADHLRQAVAIDVGKRDAVDPLAYVLDGEQPLLDQGATTGIEPGQDVYSARNVIGRVDTVGRWTSSIRLITDPEYQALARLARKSDRGMLWGAAGRLEGDGAAHCRLRSIEATQLVSVGDLVFSVQGDGALPHPMFYGRVIEAELRPGAVEWDIRIEPAGNLDALRSVHVLRQSLNPLRMMAQ